MRVSFIVEEGHGLRKGYYKETIKIFSLFTRGAKLVQKSQIDILITKIKGKNISTIVRPDLVNKLPKIDH
uniref:Putative ovule protein n=1 Tax=Solanum chacoense TaxID=4108 RepID=A0A0V0IAX8_SOLCH